MVVGDIMLDAYTWGKVDRISPEAPVPVVNVISREERPGGAANVAVNLQAMGVKTFLCGICGIDATAKKLVALIKKGRINTDGIISLDNCITTTKTRIIGNNHQLLRIDDEKSTVLTPAQNATFAKKIIRAAGMHKVDAIIFEDYDKGALNAAVLKPVIEFANRNRIITTVDPKKNNFFNYSGVSMFKPNLHELVNGLNREKIDTDDLSTVTADFLRKQRIQSMLVTLSEKGIFYTAGKKHGIVAAHLRNISDVSGAGDTVISVATCCLALHQELSIAAAIANLAGGLVCEKTGVVPVNLNELIAEIKKYKILE